MTTSSSTPQSTPSKQSSPQVPNAIAMELLKPGPEHTQLIQSVGTWKAACTFWMPGDATPRSATGTAKITSVFDGRFTREEFSGDFDGKPFQGVGTMGYDRGAKHFVYVWYDNMSTGIITTIGPAVTGQSDLILRGEKTCPMSGKSSLRQVFSRQSNDSRTLTMYNSKDGKESKSMDIVYTREH